MCHLSSVAKLTKRNGEKPAEILKTEIVRFMLPKLYQLI